MQFTEMLEKVRAGTESASVDGEPVFQFALSGDNGGDFYISVANGKGEVSEGQAEDANVTVEMSDENFNKLLHGKLNATTAFMMGKIKIKGDLSLAMKLQSLLG
ncbi:SCP2 sterol-binding domain-containing protein [Dethiobacter alkaliphilus]|uniref:SCP2 sterol-binding domain-containing protein n=1 Tax=Dethiobacter alkaliphilus TaxID=427926 RepID=UPI002225EEF4|nr:SCP2 sterol-binding domain-containing protein [Dethiobacter alkaliphilus]MCW3490365.1 SCP2 sterol-binding domain-containing protein [Dethiobacter alkaliphilus]